MYSFFFLWNPKGNIFKNVHAALFYRCSHLNCVRKEQCSLSLHGYDLREHISNI